MKVMADFHSRVTICFFSGSFVVPPKLQNLLKMKNYRTKCNFFTFKLWRAKYFNEEIYYSPTNQGLIVWNWYFGSLKSPTRQANYGL